MDKENYRPVSVLPHVSKMIEVDMYIQIENFMEDKLSKLLTGFRKKHSTRKLSQVLFEANKLIKTKVPHFLQIWSPFCYLPQNYPKQKKKRYSLYLSRDMLLMRLQNLSSVDWRVDQELNTKTFKFLNEPTLPPWKNT